jgi:beta-mannosidase
MHMKEEPNSVLSFCFTTTFVLFLLLLTDWETTVSQTKIPSKSVDMQGAGNTGSTIDLNGPWMMKDFTPGVGVTKQVYLPDKEPKNCLPIQVPGTVQTALLNAGEIPDPYYGYNNEKSLWVEEKEWWFFRKFTVGTDLQGKWINLLFEGTSFQGEVWLNGQSIGELMGMLNPRSFNVSHALKYGADNSLAVRLEATPDARVRDIVRGLTWDSPRNQLYSIAQCMYSWDWGVHSVPVGMWQPVKLQVTGPLRISHPYVRSKIVSTSRALCSIAMDVQNLSDKPLKGSLTGSLSENETDQKVTDFSQSVKLGPNETKTISFDVKVQNPRLWWPNGMGDQNLYVLNATVSVDDAKSAELKTRFGIRELKLVENENVNEFLKSMKDDTGSVYHLGKVVGSYPWTFEINGKKMFAKGGNWIPVDQLLRLDRDRYDRQLRLAKEAHFNLLRVWGGGLYETDDFYELCDQYGILAWQEFLSNRNFSKIDRPNFLDGAESAVYRLRNHPSLTFWCGGNEFDPDDKGSKAVIDALGDMLQKLDPQREFHRASPYKGDDHYWGVWHGQEPYTKYRIVRPFRSEAGVNAYPVAENFRKFTPPSFVWPPDTTYVEYHGEHRTRFLHLKKQLRYTNEFGESADIDDLIDKSGLYQALATSFNMEFCRSNKFRTSGLLIWQYNDIWPCLSWSLVDWYGTPKSSYYFLKRASRPVHISADYERYLWKASETFAADVHLLNDSESPVKASTYSVKLFDTQGKMLTQTTGVAETEANRSAKVGRIEYAIPAEMAGKAFLVVVELKGKDGVKVSDAVYPIAVSKTDNLENYNAIFTDMSAMAPVPLKASLAHTDVKFDKDGEATCALQLSNPSDKLAFFVRIRLTEESETLRTDYSDNFLSLLPGETKTVNITIENKNQSTTPEKMHFEITGWKSPAQTVEVNVDQ